MCAITVEYVMSKPVPFTLIGMVSSVPPSFVTRSATISPCSLPPLFTGSSILEPSISQHTITWGRTLSFRYGYFRNLRRQGVDLYIRAEGLRELSSVIAFQRNDRPDIGGTPFILF